MVYLIIFFITFLLNKLNNKSHKIILTISLFLIFLIFFNLLNNSLLLKLISPNSLWSKINFHFSRTNKIGVGQIFNGIFLIISYIYIYLSSKKINDLKSKTLYDFTIIFSLAIIMKILIFPNFYVFYSRLYVLGSILLGLSFSSIIFNNRQNFISVLFKNFIVIISWLSYFRILFMYKMEYLPYKSWLFN